ncbi:hypothetical protein FHW96_004156 [Novosphingobium sp. SG751A]|uniref:DUF3237 family protein n=1 Tax=Novosphingobium sp. SG751A TaxID=2587000 RepID=UPI0015549B2A|nr:DUF3237 family protein [Novosphingobium sp. SG751A]NOW47972.1 hypothetical protein [Novosphingobium sp. SG751A]
MTQPIFTPPLEFAFRIRLDFPPGARSRFALPGGTLRGYVPVIGGTVTGPRLNGTVIAHSGGDWPLIRPDGVIAFDARYLIHAEDGTPIQVFNRGYAHAPAHIQARIEAGEPIDPADNYFRISPVFEAPGGPHDWLTRTVFAGTGEKHADHSFFDVFAVG